jgi:hypothetical protein
MCVDGAAEVLLGLGADKSDWWDFSQKPGGWNVVELKWLPQKTHTRFCAKSQNICDGYPQMCIQPLHHAKLSILHLAVCPIIPDFPGQDQICDSCSTIRNAMCRARFLAEVRVHNKCTLT